MNPQYAATVFKATNGVMPPVHLDFAAFGELHSWYKRLPAVVTPAYLLLLPGREQKNYEEEPDPEYHWRFIIYPDKQLQPHHVDTCIRYRIYINREMQYERVICEIIQLQANQFWADLKAAAAKCPTTSSTSMSTTTTQQDKHMA